MNWIKKYSKWVKKFIPPILSIASAILSVNLPIKASWMGNSTFEINVAIYSFIITIPIVVIEYICELISKHVTNINITFKENNKKISTIKSGKNEVINAEILQIEIRINGYKSNLIHNVLFINFPGGSETDGLTLNSYNKFKDEYEIINNSRTMKIYLDKIINNKSKIINNYTHTIKIILFPGDGTSTGNINYRVKRKFRIKLNCSKLEIIN